MDYKVPAIVAETARDALAAVSDESDRYVEHVSTAIILSEDGAIDDREMELQLGWFLVNEYQGASYKESLEWELHGGSAAKEWLYSLNGRRITYSPPTPTEVNRPLDSDHVSQAISRIVEPIKAKKPRKPRIDKRTSLVERAGFQRGVPCVYVQKIDDTYYVGYSKDIALLSSYALETIISQQVCDTIDDAFNAYNAKFDQLEASGVYIGSHRRKQRK